MLQLVTYFLLFLLENPVLAKLAHSFVEVPVCCAHDVMGVFVFGEEQWCVKLDQISV